MRIDIFRGKKSARHAREVQREEQVERDRSIPKWRENPESLGGKLFLSLALGVSAVSFLAYSFSNFYFGLMDREKEFIQSHEKIYSVCLDLVLREDHLMDKPDITVN